MENTTAGARSKIKNRPYSNLAIFLVSSLAKKDDFCGYFPISSLVSLTTYAEYLILTY